MFRGGNDGGEARICKLDAHGDVDVSGFCKSVMSGEIRIPGHMLTHGRHIGAAEECDERVAEGENLTAIIREKLGLIVTNV